MTKGIDTKERTLILSDISIKRPVFAAVVSLILVIFGLSSMKDLAVREYPDIDAPIVSDDEASLLIKEIEGWDLIDDGVKKLKKEFSFSNYSDSVDFSNKIADMAEQEDHHPQIILEWGKVTVIWWSHKIKGLHKNDLIAAAKTDSLFSE